MADGGLLIYCPNCARLSICASIPLYKASKPKSRRLFQEENRDIQWFRRVRQCKSCSEMFLTAEVEEHFLNELVELRQLLAQKHGQVVDTIKIKSPWIVNHELIPRELAEEFVRRSAWWLTHSSGSEIRAPRHASRIRGTSHGWAVEFGANDFLVGKAIERCGKVIKQFLDEASSGKLLLLDELKKALAHQISRSVSNANGYEYEGCYPITHGQLIFGTQAIDIDDAINFLIQEIDLLTLFV